MIKADTSNLFFTILNFLYLIGQPIHLDKYVLEINFSILSFKMTSVQGRNYSHR